MSSGARLSDDNSSSNSRNTSDDDDDVGVPGNESGWLPGRQRLGGTPIAQSVVVAVASLGVRQDASVRETLTYASKEHPKREGEKNSRKRSRREVKTRRKRDAEKMAEQEQLLGKLLKDRRTLHAGIWEPANGGGSADDVQYIDTKPDRDNLAYGGLYRLDVAKFQRFTGAEVGGWVSEGVNYTRPPSVHVMGSLATKVNSHTAVMWGKTACEGLRVTGAEGRYFSPLSLMRERNRHVRRLKLTGAGVGVGSGYQRPPRARPEPFGDFAPLSSGHVPILTCAFDRTETVRGSNVIEEEGESTNDYLTRRTREFNGSTRSRPHDLGLWLRFAEFQDEFRTQTRKKSEATQLSEKKLAIIQRGLSHHPGSEMLLLALMHESAKVEDAAAVERRWEHVLCRHPESPTLWKAYIAQRKAMFAGFRTGAVRRDYREALHALSSARLRRQRSAPSAVYAGVNVLETAIADLIVEAAQFDLQAGYVEHAIGRLQAAVEFACFGPAAETSGLSEANAMRLFESFWECGEARAGEAGAKGWASWVERSEGLAAGLHGRVGGSSDEGDGCTEHLTGLDTARMSEMPQLPRLMVPTRVPVDEVPILPPMLGCLHRQHHHCASVVPPPPLRRSSAGVISPPPPLSCPLLPTECSEGMSPPSSSPFSSSSSDDGSDAIVDKMEGDVVSKHNQDQANERVNSKYRKEEQEEEAPVVSINVDGNAQDEEDEAVMIVRLGLQLDEAAAAEVDDAALELWLGMEVVRDVAQWLPLRDFGNVDIGCKDEDVGGKGDSADREGYLDRLQVVCFDDIREGLTNFSCEAARMRLLTRAFESLGCPLYPWESAADPGLADRLQSAEYYGGPFNAFPKGEGAGLKCDSIKWLDRPLADIPGEAPAWLTPSDGEEATWAQAATPSAGVTEARGSGGSVTSRASFLTQLLHLAAATFPGHAPLALARVEQARCSAGVGAAKACAKAMLADHHGGCIPLWVAFARLERSSGRKQAARKVYDRVIAALPSLLPRDAASSAAALALACAEDELADDTDDSSGRAVGALVVLSEFALGIQRGSGDDVDNGGGGGDQLEVNSFSGCAVAMPPLRLLRARRGLQQMVGNALAGGSGMVAVSGEDPAPPSPLGFGANFRPEGVAAVAAAALFEQLVSGADTATTVFAEALAAAPASAQRAAAPAWEALHLRHLRHLYHIAAHHRPPTSPSYIRSVINAVLDIFPASPAVLIELATHELHVCAHHRLRRSLDSAYQRDHNPLLWYLALRVETHAAGGGDGEWHHERWLAPRWRATFERALAADAYACTAGVALADKWSGADAVAVPTESAMVGRGKQTPLLWRCYLGAELATGRPAAARRVFLRAINACPWDKAIWLVGLRELSGVFTVKERSGLLDMMKEKEVRIRMDMYEVLLERTLAD